MRYASHTDSKRGNAAKLRTVTRRQERALKVAGQTGQVTR